MTGQREEAAVSDGGRGPARLRGEHDRLGEFQLRLELELGLAADGTPSNPLAVLELDRWRDATDATVSRAAGLVAAALPISVGVLRGPMTPGLAPLAAAASLTLSEETADDLPAGAARMVIPISDIRGRRGLETSTSASEDLDVAVGRLRDAVARSPRAAIACGQLVRQTAALGASAGLAAEASAYSLLLGGPEFARWLAERGPGRARTDGGRADRPNRAGGPGQPAGLAAPPAAPVLLTRDGGRLSIVLNVPERRNAFSAEVREALLDAVLLAEADETIESVTLSGAGPAFCSGGDLDEFGTATDLVAASLVRLTRAPWRVIERIAPKVTVLAHGACIGAGTEIAAYAGRVVAAPDAFFALPEVGMGLVPGAGGSVSVVARIGRWRAAWLMLTGERLPATTALRWGLVDEIAAG
jgi:Enoyl-CoA hydratase/isomerase